MSNCLDLKNQIINSSLLPSCTTLSFISLINCIFFNLKRINYNGGAIFINWIESFNLITNCYFEQCESNYGGAFMISSGKNSTIFLNCFFNCSAAVYGQAFELKNFNSNSNTQISFNSFSFCSWNKKGGYLTIDLFNGKCNLNNLNNSNSYLSGWSSIYSNNCSPYIEYYCSYFSNIASLILHHVYSSNGIIYNLNIINNSYNSISSYNSFVYDYQLINFTLFNSIFSLNFFPNYRFLYDGTLMIKNCSFFQNSFIESNINFNPTYIEIFFINTRNCLSLNTNYLSIPKKTKFKLEFLIFIFYLN